MSRTSRQESPSYKGHVLDTTRDRKKWYKPGKNFKKPRRSSEKAKVKQAIKLEKEVFPIFKRNDVWDWN